MTTLLYIKEMALLMMSKGYVLLSNAVSPNAVSLFLFLLEVSIQESLTVLNKVFMSAEICCQWVTLPPERLVEYKMGICKNAGIKQAWFGPAKEEVIIP